MLFRSCFALILCSCLGPLSLRAAFSHPGALHTALQLDAADDLKAKTQVLTLADQLLNESSDAVRVFDVPGYFLDPTVQQTKVRQLQTDVRAAYASALAFQLTGKIAYATTAKRLVLSWVDTNTVVTGYDGPIVMTYLGVGFLVAADLVWDCFTPEEIVRLRNWSHNVFYLQASNLEQTKHQNNHRTWGIYASLVVAAIRHDSALFTAEVAKWKSHVSESIATNGSMPLELARGDRAGWYTYFALAPMLAGAQVIQNVTGEQVWDYQNGAIERALNYLYANYAYPDRLGAGSSCNPENLFAAAKEVYPAGRWLSSGYLNFTLPIDASQDQHLAWEFPILLKAGRQVSTPAPTPAPDNTGSEYTLAVTWLRDSANLALCTLSEVNGQTFIAVQDTSRTIAAKLNSTTMPVIGGRTHELSVTARRRSGAAIDIALVFRDQAGNVALSASIQPNLGNWTTYRIARQVPANAVSVQVSIRSATGTTGVTEIKTVALQER